MFAEEKLIEINDPHINIKLFNKKIKVDYETKYKRIHSLCRSIN